MKKFIIIATFSSLLIFLIELTIIRYADAAPINLSLNPNALAVANSEYVNGSASNAIDGVHSTMWNAGDWATPSKHYFLIIDIGDVHPVNSIVLKSKDSPTSPAYYINYMLLTSIDNINWDTIVAFDRLIDSADGYFDIIDTGTTLMRYVKFEVIGGTHWAHLNEIEIWGESEIEGHVPVDIKPGSCPNPLNVNSKGVLPVAIAGTFSFDVTQVDPVSVLLEGVAPLRWAYVDTTTPFEPFLGKQDCNEDCDELCPDGILDLAFNFDRQEIVAALSDVADGDCVVFHLTGNLKDEFGGTPIFGEDVILILEKGNN